MNREAFIDGYIETALWADCMPPLPERARELQREIAEVYARGVYIPERQLMELDSITQDLEMGGGEDLEMRAHGRELMAADCHDFIDANLSDLEAYCEQMGAWHGTDSVRGENATYSAEERAGGDFWLTRNGHGSGFWDRGLGELGERLTEAAKVYNTGPRVFDCGDGTADAEE